MSRSLGLKTALMAFFTGISRISGLVRSVVLASFFGTSGVGDAFLLAFRFPNLLRRLFGEGAMSAGFIPIFTELLEKSKKGGESHRIYFTRIFSLLLVILSLLNLLAIVFSPLLVDFFYLGQSGVSGETKELATTLFRLMFPYLLFISLASIVQGVLNAHDEFTVPAITPVFLNLAMIGSAMAYLFFYHEDIDRIKAYFLCGGVLLGGLIQFFFQVPWLYKLGYRLKLSFDFNDPELKRFFKLMLPAIFSAGIYQLNTLLVDPFAVALGEGSVSALFYSLRLQELPLGMIVVSIATVSLPSFSRYHAAGDFSTLSVEIEKSLNLTGLILFPIILFSFFYGQEMISLLFGYGNFGVKAVELTAACFFFHIASLWFVGMARILTNVFFAGSDTKTPLTVSVVGMIVNIFLAWFLTRVIKTGVAGLAMAGGLASAVMALLYFYLLRKKSHTILSRSFYWFHVKLLLCMILPAVLIYLFKQYGPSHFQPFHFSKIAQTKIDLFLSISLATLILISAFSFSLWIFRMEEGKKLMSLLRRRFHF